jgi:Zn-dependent protease
MRPLQAGSIRLFRAAGINVYLHWTWFIVAVFMVQQHQEQDRSPVWNAVEYVTLFAIVLLHEFGHALACRSVGGIANRIVLWPLGGVAFVQPPPRPGPLLWSIAAGPLVNLALVPVTVGIWGASYGLGWKETWPALHTFFFNVMIMNCVLLGLNLVPIYPLDGGQILQSILWFFMDRATSLMVVSIMGLIAGLFLMGMLGLLILLIMATGASALFTAVVWFGVLGLFILFRSWVGFQQARLLSEIYSRPRHPNLKCPRCGAAPFAGPFWICALCQERFDPFAHEGVCPRCCRHEKTMQCIECGRTSPAADWRLREAQAEKELATDEHR